jgi:hypothetical protein
MAQRTPATDRHLDDVREVVSQGTASGIVWALAAVVFGTAVVAGGLLAYVHFFVDR